MTNLTEAQKYDLRQAIATDLETGAIFFPLIASRWRNLKKGIIYRVLYRGAHTETGEALVVYQGVGENAPADPDDVWCRPLSMWYEKFETVDNVCS